ncbi:secretory phospholipase A2 receptor-like isoform X2 [Myripristis murdjan]|uniref:secretory phospholipase A2 receptor-like isoform X2 n=1 Tax=Myripristis murdjan TaxID=586833 RepID=UPI0011760320|nr:secretory phospholipase A2 receptor-like isoform X2 [Myripristis murdjan]
MGGKAFIIVIMSGLCTLPSCFPRQYHLVEEEKTWSEAQSHCRQHHKDLATVASKEEVNALNDVLAKHDQHEVWIGLHRRWRWSLENKTYYGEGEVEFRMWVEGKPDIYWNKNCAVLYDENLWDYPCSRRLYFICYNAQGQSRFILVKESKTWTEAQSHCRQHFTDLASVRNQSENEEIFSLVREANHRGAVWIGLFRDEWKWSDGSAMSFTNWNTQRPDVINTQNCVATKNGKWKTSPCSERNYFVCYSAADEEPQPTPNGS